METYKWLLLTTGGIVKIQNIYGQSAAKLLNPLALWAKLLGYGEGSTTKCLWAWENWQFSMIA